MHKPIARRRRPSIESLATAFASAADGSEEQFVIPDAEGLAAMSDEDLATLAERAGEHFDALYGDGQALSAEELEVLTALGDGIRALSAELATRQTTADERAAAAAALAAEVRPNRAPEAPLDESDGDEEGDEEDEDDEEQRPETDEANVEEGEEALVASGTARRAPIRVPMSSIRSRAAAQHAPTPAEPARDIRGVLSVAAPGLAFEVGAGVNWREMGSALDKRLGSYSHAVFANAAAAGQSRSERGSLAVISRQIPDDLVIRDDDPERMEEVFARATSESRLPGGSLVAAGGWCAPSETLYDLLEMESRDGLLSIPEVGVRRGGIRFTKGPAFQDIFKDITGFHFTEQEDIDGKYAPGTNPGDPNVVGPKPCYKVECPDFEEYRLGVDGLCIQSGLLQQRGYPEVLARTLRGALVAHDHRLNGRMLAQMAAGSTAITMPATQVGTLAPILTSIELQVEHYRYTHRLTRSTTLEAIFPFWVRGAIRSDLSRRLGVDMTDVPDSRIDAWFRSRGINPQYVYNWQAIDPTAATAFTAWPTQVSFQLYAAGTWIRGAADIITIDTLYDSTLLGNNDFTALFTEEGWFVAKRGFDARLITTTISADGATHIGVDIAHNGTLVTTP